jgi:hypothetical protein
LNGTSEASSLKKLISLLKQQRTYWKQRGKIRCVKEGDARTRFFYGHATIFHRKNKTAPHQNILANNLQSHEEKTDLLWNLFKERMGISEFQQITFNLDDLIQPAQGLESQEVQFTRKEIDDVVSKLPNNRLPGPNGYNNEFVKGCCHS